MTEQTADAVIWMARNDDCLSFVVDDRDSASGRMVQEIIESIRQHRRQMRETRKEARAA